MTVGELIEALQKFNPDLPVWSYLGDEPTEIDSVKEVANNSVWLS